MTATAAKGGYGTGTWDAGHAESRLTQSRYEQGYKTVKVLTDRRQKPISEPSLTDDEQRRAGYMRVQKSLHAGESTIVMKAVVHGTSYHLIGASVPIEQPKRSASPQASLVPTAKQISSAKKFTMHLEHLNFLKRVSTGECPPITPETAHLASKAWHIIWKASDYRMPVPSAGTGPNGEMFYAWNSGRHHLELEIIPGQPAEFFYRDRESGEFWGMDYDVGATLPVTIISKLTLFR